MGIKHFYIHRSEGSLNQHIKIKHPEIYAEKSICSNNIANNNSFTYSE